jgi:hypothetical protein
MNDPEGFVSRWSRRKRDVSREAEPAASTKPVEESAEAAEDSTSDVPARQLADSPTGLAFDPKSLPSIESITAETDIRGFLAAGVPPELTRAALRRAWASDPGIRNFVGLADYDWDFNAAAPVAGFGPPPTIEEIGNMAERIMEPDRAALDTHLDAHQVPHSASAKLEPERGKGAMEGDASGNLAGQTDDQTGPSEDGSEKKSGASSPSNELPQRGRVFAATQNEGPSPDKLKVIAKRQHGGALPT